MASIQCVDFLRNLADTRKLFYDYLQSKTLQYRTVYREDTDLCKNRFCILYRKYNRCRYNILVPVPLVFLVL